MPEINCKKCLILKDFNEYHKDASKKNGIRTICKDCVKNKNVNYYSNNKDTVYKDKYVPTGRSVGRPKKELK
jgi:hypothetical protein